MSFCKFVSVKQVYRSYGRFVFIQRRDQKSFLTSLKHRLNCNVFENFAKCLFLYFPSVVCRVGNFSYVSCLFINIYARLNWDLSRVGSIRFILNVNLFTRLRLYSSCTTIVLATKLNILKLSFKPSARKPETVQKGSLGNRGVYHSVPPPPRG